MAIHSEHRQPPPGGPMTEEEYLQLDQNVFNAKYEYIDGVAKLMAGGSVAADRIGYNSRVALDQHFLSGPCTVFGPDVKVLIGSKPNGKHDYYYPDVTISCNVSDRRRDNKLIRSPHIVVEVLSPGTEKDDRVIKLANYKALPTMYEIVLISQFAPHVEVYTRGEDGTTWTYMLYGPGEQVLLDSLDVRIGMDEIYRGINFDEPLTQE